MYLIQNLRCTNDANGNPRRVWAIYHAEDDTNPNRPYAPLVRVVDEGYAYSRAADAMAVVGLGGEEGQPIFLILPSIDITPAEYRLKIQTGERLSPHSPYRVVWADGGHWCYARTRAQANRIAKEYNHPYRNDANPIRVRVELNERSN